MNKRKIVLLAMSLCMVAILAVGGTLAYFTDTDAQVNTFTVGNVQIDLFENFGDNDGVEKLIPAVFDEDGDIINNVKKEIYVQNIGSERAYVRVHIAIPAILEQKTDANPNGWSAEYPIVEMVSSFESEQGATWNWNGRAPIYQTNVDNIEYNVYVLTYETALEPDGDDPNNVTIDALSYVYMDSAVTNEDISGIMEAMGKDQWFIFVAAEGGQVDGFNSASEALNTQFGVLAADYNLIDWNKVAEGNSKGRKFEEYPPVE